MYRRACLDPWKLASQTWMSLGVDVLRATNRVSTRILTGRSGGKAFFAFIAAMK
jgi:hypothetical protein